MLNFNAGDDLYSRLPEWSENPDPLERVTFPAQRRRVRKRRMGPGSKLLVFLSVPFAMLFIPIISLETYGIDTNILGMVESFLEPEEEATPKPVGIPRWDEPMRLDRSWTPSDADVPGGSGWAMDTTEPPEPTDGTASASEPVSPSDELRQRFRNPLGGLETRSNFDRFLESLNDEFTPTSVPDPVPSVAETSPPLEGSRSNFDAFLGTLSDRGEPMDRDRLRALFHETAPETGSRGNFDRFLESLRD